MAAEMEACTGGIVDRVVCEVAQRLGLVEAAIILCVLSGIAWYLRSEWQLLGRPADDAFQRRIDIVRERGFRERYLSRLKRTLAIADRWFGELGPAKPGGWIHRVFGCQPWTAFSYERLLNLAFVYPVVFFFSGEYIDYKELFETCATLTIVVVLYIFGLLLRRRIDRPQRRGSRGNGVTIAGFLAVVFAAVIADTGVGTGAFTFNGPAAVVFVGAFAFTFAYAGAVAFVGTLIGNYVGFYAIKFIAGGVADGTSDIVNNFIAVGAMAFAFVIAITIAAMVTNRRDQQALKGRLTSFLWWMTLMCLLITATMIYFTGNQFITAALLIFIIFPIVNAPLDWLSLGVTRGLLRRIADGHHQTTSALWWAFIDTMLALIFLLAVALSCLLGVLLVNRLAIAGGAQDVIPIRDLLSTLKGNKSDGQSIAIWMILGSTLIPTYLHFLVALWACVVFPFNRVDASETADALQNARNLATAAIDRNDFENAAAVLTDTDARRNSFIYLMATRLVMAIVFVLWLVVVIAVSWSLFKALTWGFVTIIETVA